MKGRYLLETITYLFNYLIDNWIAIASLALSAYIAYTNSIKLKVNFGQAAIWLYDIPTSSKRLEYSLDFRGMNLVKTTIRIINSSNTDISFFDLQVFDPQSGDGLTYFSKLIFQDIYNMETAPKIAKTSKNMATTISLPESNAGIIKANSLTNLDIIVPLENRHYNDIAIVFHVAKRKNPFSYIWGKISKRKRDYSESSYVSFYGTSAINWSSKLDCSSSES